MPPDSAHAPKRSGVVRWTGIWPARKKPLRESASCLRHFNNPQTESPLIVTEISSSVEFSVSVQKLEKSRHLDRSGAVLPHRRVETPKNNRHPDRSDGRSHRPSRSGGIPEFCPCPRKPQPSPNRPPVLVTPLPHKSVILSAVEESRSTPHPHVSPSLSPQTARRCPSLSIG